MEAERGSRPEREEVPGLSEKLTDATKMPTHFPEYLQVPTMDAPVSSIPARRAPSYLPPLLHGNPVWWPHLLDSPLGASTGPRRRKHSISQCWACFLKFLEMVLLGLKNPGVSTKYKPFPLYPSTTLATPVLHLPPRQSPEGAPPLCQHCVLPLAQASGITSG